MQFEPEVIFLEEDAADYPLARQTLRRFPHTPVRAISELASGIDEIKRTAADVFGAGKRQLALSRFKGSFLKKCPGASKGMVCCNYYVVNLIKNCIYDCSYCFLQDFLENNPVMSAYVNVEDLLHELDEILTGHPDQLFRVGTGELTDSLALDDVIPYSEYLVPFFRKKNNAVLELKTKSARVENLLKQEGTRNVIVSWSLNPQEIIDREEKGTASFEERLEAARLCQNRGYRIGFHFDPILLFPGWEQAYENLVNILFQKIAPSSIEWISLGIFV